MTQATASGPRRARPARIESISLSGEAIKAIANGQSQSCRLAEIDTTRLQQNAGKWPLSYIDGPGALAYKPPQSRRLIAAASGAAETPRETDLSAEQTGTQTPPRLSRAYGNKRRPQGCGRAARTGPQKTERLSATGSMFRLHIAANGQTRSQQSRCNGAVETPE